MIRAFKRRIINGDHDYAKNWGLEMPISKSDFEHGLDEEVKKVLAFLLGNNEEAFTSTEISEATGFDLRRTRQILGYITEKQYVKSKDIGANRYYMFQRMP